MSVRNRVGIIELLRSVVVTVPQFYCSQFRLEFYQSILIHAFALAHTLLSSVATASPKQTFADGLRLEGVEPLTGRRPPTFPAPAAEPSAPAPNLARGVHAEYKPLPSPPPMLANVNRTAAIFARQSRRCHPKLLFFLSWQSGHHGDNPCSYSGGAVKRLCRATSAGTRGPTVSEKFLLDTL